MMRIKNPLKLEDRINQKSLAVAHIAKFFADAGFEDKGEYYEQIARQMISEGIRKIGDDAELDKEKGKYLGHEYWSENARKLLSENDDELTGITLRTFDKGKHDKSQHKRHYIVHEHVFPVEELVKKLLAHSCTTPPEDYAAEIKKFSIIAIVTGEEDAKLKDLPIDWSEDNLWIRYEKAELLDQIVPDPRTAKALHIG